MESPQKDQGAPYGPPLLRGRSDENQLGTGCWATALKSSVFGLNSGSDEILAPKGGMRMMASRFGLSDIVTLVVAGVIMGVFAVFVRDWWQAGLIVFDLQFISDRLVAFGRAYF